MTAPLHLLAQKGYPSPPADGLVSFYWGRAERFDDPRWLWGGVLLAAVLLTLFVVWQYRRESGALSRGVSILLAALRLTAIGGAIVFFLAPMKRTDQQVVTESRVVLLVDTSQSMAVQDERATEDAKISRSDAVLAALQETPFLRQLRLRHDVALVAFDSELRRIAQWKRLSKEADEPPDANSDADATTAAPETPDSGATPSNASGTGSLPEALKPLGAETRIGDALAAILSDQSVGPLAGVIAFTDGGQNIGLDPLATTKSAKERSAQFVPVGLGSSDPRRNIGVQELIAPSRAYPNDKAVVKAIIAAEGLAGRTFQVDLLAREDQAAALPLGQESVTIEADGTPAAVEFTLEPAKIGRLELEARIAAPEEDQYHDDNQRTAEVDVVDDTAKILLIASGATRDYRFLRNQLQRDAHTSVDVLLQLSPPGISQDADKILTEFPATKEELFEYDAIVAFDPDWTQLDARNVDLLEQWVAEEAGGMIVVAGPVHTAAWLQSSEHAKIRSLYPVEFQRRLTLLDDGLFGSKQPWPIEFTREGAEADFLWIGDTAAESRERWAQFPGVFGCYAVKGAKPGAQVYGRYGDPDAGISVDRPIYFADHFYGAGRVFYMGSGELWRLRAVDPGYFEQLYTQLVRHVSEGRLLRGSSAGRLLVDRDRYYVGDTVLVRAQLTTASREPYVASRVAARVAGPGEPERSLQLQSDPTRPGNFAGQFTVTREGAYRIEVSPPDAPEETLLKRISVSVPDLEFKETRRNEPLLTALATRTGGHYYPSIDLALQGDGDAPPAAELLKSRAETKTLRGKPDDQFAESVHKWLLGVICGALCIEWLTRRLSRLA